MEHPLRLLIVDDQQPDAELSARQIARGGYPCTWRRVETEAEFRAELRGFAPDLILSDFTLPQYDGLSALELAVSEAPGVPFIFVSGTIGEKRAAEALTRGAADYVSKSDLTRLVPALTRVLRESRALATLQTLPDKSVAPHFSTLDPLTGLPKREVFCEHLALMLRRRADKSTNPTVIVFDVERLRDINDAHGRHVGDHLLQSVAERLKRRFGGRTDLAYCGSGTFVAVFTELRRQPEATTDSPTAIFGQPFAIGGSPITVTIKCGLARYPAHGRDAETLVQYAQAALEKIRDRHDMPTHLPRRANGIDPGQRMLEQRLRLALSQQQFFVHYQPLIERVSGRIIAVEALLRWRDPERGLVSPGVFLPTLEHTGLIIPVGEWVLAQAAHDFAHWQSLGLPKIRVAVNISPAELSRKDFAGYFLDVAGRRPVHRASTSKSRSARCSRIPNICGRLCVPCEGRACASPSTISAWLNRRSAACPRSRSTA